MDWVHCNSCFHLPYQKPKRDFLLTSCGHIFCQSCERSEQKGKCKVCGESCSTTPLGPQIIQDVREYFEEPESAIQKVQKVIEFQKLHRLKLIGYFKQVWEKYQKLKFAYQRLAAENEVLKKENKMYRMQHNVMTPPLSSPKTPPFIRNTQQSQFIRMQGQENKSPNSPFFTTPSTPVPSSQNYRTQKTPSTSRSDASVSPGSVSSLRSYRSAYSQQRMCRPGLTPPLNGLRLLSVNKERARDGNSRY